MATWSDEVPSVPASQFPKTEAGFIDWLDTNRANIVLGPNETWEQRRAQAIENYNDPLYAELGRVLGVRED